MTRPAYLFASTAALVAALGSIRGEAHKPITSPYTYNEDVFPILRDRCGRCHVPGGVAPMSLMTYKDAFPWGESIRTELIAGHMPPGGTDQAAGTFQNTRELSARELNILLVWLTGGNPMGNAEHTPPAVALQHDWPLGAPDLVVPMPSAFTIAGRHDRRHAGVHAADAERRAALAASRRSAAGDAGNGSQRNRQREDRRARHVAGRPRDRRPARDRRADQSRPPSSACSPSGRRATRPVAARRGPAFQLPVECRARPARALQEDVGERTPGDDRPLERRSLFRARAGNRIARADDRSVRRSPSNARLPASIGRSGKRKSTAHRLVRSNGRRGPRGGRALFRRGPGECERRRPRGAA